jgi:hypothetical protein
MKSTSPPRAGAVFRLPSVYTSGATAVPGMLPDGPVNGRVGSWR